MDMDVDMDMDTDMDMGKNDGQSTDGRTDGWMDGWMHTRVRSCEQIAQTMCTVFYDVHVIYIDIYM